MIAFDVRDMERSPDPAKRGATFLINDLTASFAAEASVSLLLRRFKAKGNARGRVVS
ncbi:hypothetical protein [Nonomuraea sp. NPDC049158]|uniref:hypothetical protein n=1 Tax=Nonomuraea sp. NPDC049158 TaxID=3155649 RepID=UPI00340D1C14